MGNSAPTLTHRGYTRNALGLDKKSAKTSMEKDLAAAVRAGQLTAARRDELLEAIEMVADGKLEKRSRRDICYYDPERTYRPNMS